MPLEDDGMFWMGGQAFHPNFLRENGLVTTTELRDAQRRAVVHTLNLVMTAPVKPLTDGFEWQLPTATEVLRDLARHEAAAQKGI